MVLRYFLSFALLIAAVITLGASRNTPLPGAPGDRSDRSRDIKFSHKFHIEQAGAECAACHAAAATSKSSRDNLLTKKADCASCHDVQDPDECAKCHVDVSNARTWTSPDRELIFSHEAHVTGLAMACETCHAGMETVDYASQASMPSMTTCNTCHNDRKATNLCESCHRDFVTLVPADHRNSDFLRNHRETVRLGALETTCQTCHREEIFCQQCHQNPALKALGGTRDLAPEPMAKRSTRDSPRQLNLQNVHELNYRFTHGIDAKGRASECQSCHTEQSFCADCHAAGGNITQSRFKPASHGVPGFVILGRGSGGGLHASDAKRDIESCTGCHNIEGRDPTCMVCHTDAGGVR